MVNLEQPWAWRNGVPVWVSCLETEMCINLVSMNQPEDEIRPVHTWLTVWGIWLQD